jgi:predicted kinase
MKPLLIIVSGPPCSGKTTIAKRISNDLGFPLFYKDGFKELLFDSLGWKDREWSKKIGYASLDLLFNTAEVLLSSGKSLVLESNFKSEFDTKRFIDLQQKYDFDVYQIQLKCDSNVLLSRFETRSNSSERHPGHVDSGNIDEFKESLLKGTYEHLDVGDEITELDTTDFNKVNYEDLLTGIKSKFL